MWEPTGAIVVRATVGEFPEPIFTWLTTFFLSNHMRYEPENVFGPGTAPHDGPYNDEMFDLALVKGLVPQQAFSVAQYTPRSGIVLLLSIVPSDGAREGLAAEFDWGPIIPNDLFPLTLAYDILEDGEQAFDAPDSLYPAHDTLSPPVRSDRRTVDGASHVVVGFPANESYTKVGPGNFEYVVSIEDKAQGKWLVHVPYTVQ
jgi:hypothetical protein